MICVLIKMAGNGVRFGSSIPKQFYEIGGEPLFVHVLKKYKEISLVDNFIIVTNPEWMNLTKDYANKILGEKVLGMVCGGETNLKSTYNGVKFASKRLKKGDVLLVHDITDPIIDSKAIINAIHVAKKHGSVTVVTEQVHTLYSVDEDNNVIGTISKNTVGSGYSPEAFEISVLWKAFSMATEEDLCNKTSALELVLSKGISPKVVVSHQLDLKITYREDMDALKKLIDNGENLYEA